MDIKRLVVFLQAGEPCEGRVSFAAALAARRGALVTGICIPHEPDLDPADGWVIGPAAIADVLADRKARMAEIMAPTEQSLRSACVDRGVGFEWVVSSIDEPAADLAVRARCCDLVLVGQPSPTGHMGRRLADLAALVSGTPCLVGPDFADASGIFERIVVAWNGSREAKRALSDALPFLATAKSVSLVTVEGEPRQPQTAASGAEALNYLARHGVAAELECVEAVDGNAGAALLKHCSSFKADLMVMGAYGHSRATEMILGGATRTVLAKATLPVLMSH